MSIDFIKTIPNIRQEVSYRYITYFFLEPKRHMYVICLFKILTSLNMIQNMSISSYNFDKQLNVFWNKT